MTGFEIWGSLGRYGTAGEESDEHLWGKVELDRRRRDKVDPWFPGEYRFERKAADRVPDCMILGGLVNRWIEFVTGSDQEYRAKTREALRLGFVVHWVFHSECETQMWKAQRELTPELKHPFGFGVFDPCSGLLELGVPLTYKNYAFPVESMDEFSVKEIHGYRSGAARIRRAGGGFDLGVLDLAGCQRRLIVHDKQGKYFRAAAPSQSIADAPWGYPTRDGLQRLVEAEQVTRLGPVRYRDPD